MFMFKTNEPVKVIHLQNLPNQSMLSGALVIEIVNNSFSESKKNFRLFDKAGTFKLKKKGYVQRLDYIPSKLF